MYNGSCSLFWLLKNLRSFAFWAIWFSKEEGTGRNQEHEVIKNKNKKNLELPFWLSGL